LNNLEIKRKLGKLWHYLPHNASRRVILIYHSIGSAPWAISEQVFYAQMEWLKTQAEVVPLDTLLSSPVRTGLQVSLTFDDGYRCVHNVAAPVIRSLSFPATVYLNTGLISDKGNIPSDPSLGHYPGEQFMTWDEVEDLYGDGWLIGSHGVDHLDLTRVDAGTIQRQASDSKTDIETRLGVKCMHFSYTWGRHNPLVRQAIKETNYRYATGCLHSSLSPSADPFMLPRLNIKKEYAMDDFMSVITGEWDFIGIAQRFGVLS